MAIIPASTSTLSSAIDQVRSILQGIKNQGNNAITLLQASSVSTDWVFALLDQLRNVVSSLNALKTTQGLDAYASAQWPTYTGTLSTDIGTVVTNATSCISWVTSNFPTDTGGFLMGYTLNADGSRTARQFTPAQTAGLVAALQTLVNSIG